MRQLRRVTKLWYRADHATANAGCALIAGYPAGLLTACGVSPIVIASGKVSGEVPGDVAVQAAYDISLKIPRSRRSCRHTRHCTPIEKRRNNDGGSILALAAMVETAGVGA